MADDMRTAWAQATRHLGVACTACGKGCPRAQLNDADICDDCQVQQANAAHAKRLTHWRAAAARVLRRRAESLGLL